MINYKTYLTLCSFLLIFPSVLKAQLSDKSKDIFFKISVEEYQDKVKASWLGQLIGNIVGLPHENNYIDEPGPERYPTDYSWPEWGNTGKVMQDVLEERGGAFSDDDTDLEYMYLILMEKHGCEPSYKEITEAWKYHIRKRLWVANRAALGLMHYGFYPPHTGRKNRNFHWFQIDPQLVNEIWAITAPGMIEYAAQKSSWAAQITNDDFGLEPTIHYGAMYAAAFFERDVNKLIDIGNQALPSNSRFVEVVKDMRNLYKKYPKDWRAARKEAADKYFHKEPAESKHIVAATINGACGILALLYGQGDFQKTLDLACLMGFDADNQAATMSGLIALSQGSQAIPSELLMPIDSWAEPLNNVYKNMSRHDLPDAKIDDIVKRLAEQGEKLILQKGGSKIIENGKEYYLINPKAQFVPPFEFLPYPITYADMNEEIEVELYAGGMSPSFKIIEGEFPPGLSLNGNWIKGKSNQTGEYSVKIKAEEYGKSMTQEFVFIIHGKNLALEANKIIINQPNEEIDSEILRDGVKVGFVNFQKTGTPKPQGSIYGPNFQDTYNSTATKEPKIDYYGYAWDDAQKVGRVSLYLGQIGFQDGWFNSIRVEYLHPTYNVWLGVNNLKITPDFEFEPWSRLRPSYVEYNLSFDSVEAAGIRVLGEAIGYVTRYTPVSELAVYENY